MKGFQAFLGVSCGDVTSKFWDFQVLQGCRPPDCVVCTVASCSRAVPILTSPKLLKRISLKKLGNNQTPGSAATPLTMPSNERMVREHSASFFCRRMVTGPASAMDSAKGRGYDEVSEGLRSGGGAHQVRKPACPSSSTPRNIGADSLSTASYRRAQCCNCARRLLVTSPRFLVIENHSLLKFHPWLTDLTI